MSVFSRFPGLFQQTGVIPALLRQAGTRKQLFAGAQRSFVKEILGVTGNVNLTLIY